MFVFVCLRWQVIGLILLHFKVKGDTILKMGFIIFHPKLKIFLIFFYNKLIKMY
jgi:hypothetical protein